MKLKLSFLGLLFILCSTSIIPQDDISKETNTDIQQLEDFHDIIYPIWHTAYPEKDVAALKSYKDEVNNKAEAIYNVKLPGILKEKEAKWNEGVKTFKGSVKLYNEAAAGKDDKAMLDAAEKLHSDYEALIKIVYPTPAQVEDFHKSLYVLYHKYLPENNYEKVIEISEEMKTKAAEMKNAKLSKKKESRRNEYLSAVSELMISIEEMSVSTKDNYKTLAEKVHNNYLKIEKIFDN